MGKSERRIIIQHADPYSAIIQVQPWMVLVRKLPRESYLKFPRIVYSGYFPLPHYVSIEKEGRQLNCWVTRLMWASRDDG